MTGKEKNTLYVSSAAFCPTAVKSQSFLFYMGLRLKPWQQFQT